MCAPHCTYVYTHIYSIYIYTYMHMHTHTHRPHLSVINTHIFIYTYIHAYAHTHTHTHRPHASVINTHIFTHITRMPRDQYLGIAKQARRNVSQQEASRVQTYNGSKQRQSSCEIVYVCMCMYVLYAWSRNREFCVSLKRASGCEASHASCPYGVISACFGRCEHLRGRPVLCVFAWHHSWDRNTPWVGRVRWRRDREMRGSKCELRRMRHQRDGADIQSTG
jgi:hypothetical protein